jgi:ABC-type nitrate/sulfonate/bicarbonate transport system substrate-binding protein
VSGLDQPLLIATTGYHVGHQRSIRAAEEQGYFQEEGLDRYVYDYRGLIPGPLEREGLALAMREHGVDVACGATVASVLFQRARGEDVLIVGGWRHMTRPMVISKPEITRIEDLKGKRVGLRERGGLSDRPITVGLLKAGIDPDREVTWVEDPVFAYPNNEDHVDFLRTGKVDVITTGGAFAEKLLKEGYYLLIDGNAPERRTRPGRVVVATAQTVERRGDELRAFLRANLRGFWFWSDAANFEKLVDLEARMRRNYTHNVDERGFQMTRRPAKMEDSLFPLDGQVDAQQLGLVIEEMALLGELPGKLTTSDVLRGEQMAKGFAELSQRAELRPTIERVRKAMGAA